MAAVVVASLLAIGPLLASQSSRGGDDTQPDAERAESESRSANPTNSVPQTLVPWREFAAEEIEESPLGDFLSSPVETSSGWLALRRGPRGNQLVQSTNGLEWELVETQLRGGNLFGLGYSPGRGYRTLVNSASLNEQRFTLTSSESVDGIDWDPTEAAILVVFGNLPTHVSLRGETTVVVGDRPLDIDEPPPALLGILSSYVSPSLAERTCGLTLDRSDLVERIDLLDCNGALVGSISDDSPQRLNTFSMVAFLLRFQQVVSAQLEPSEIEEIVLPAGHRIVAIEATNDGFLAVAIDSLAGVDPDTVVIGQPPGLLMRWTRAEGLVDVTAGLSEAVNLTAWRDNDLVVAPDGAALLATSSAVYRAEWPYERWISVSQGPSASGDTNSGLKIGPLGAGVVFADSVGHVWLGRIGQDWVRAPSLDGGVPREVLLSTDKFVFAILQYDSFVFRLVRVPLPTVDGSS